MLLEVVLIIVFIALFILLTFDSPHHILASTANFDSLKYVLNKIAKTNDVDIL
jgi:hypothetical protein